MRRKGPAVRPARRLARPLLDERGVCFLPGRRLGLLGLFERQQQLILGQGFGATAEPVTLQRLDDQSQPLTLGTLLEQHRLERAGIVRERRSRRGHKADRITSAPRPRASQ